jgi:hypothetical protein
MVKILKAISALPVPLAADTIYLVRNGTGFTQYVTDSTGTVAYQTNAASSDRYFDGGRANTIYPQISAFDGGKANG